MQLCMDKVEFLQHAIWTHAEYSYQFTIFGKNRPSHMFCKFRNTSLSAIEKLFEDCKLKLDLADIESFAIETVVVS